MRFTQFIFSIFTLNSLCFCTKPEVIVKILHNIDLVSYVAFSHDDKYALLEICSNINSRRIVVGS